MRHPGQWDRQRMWIGSIVVFITLAVLLFLAVFLLGGRT